MESTAWCVPTTSASGGDPVTQCALAALSLFAGEPRDDGGEDFHVRLEGDEVGEPPALAARVQGFHHLVHGADQHVRSLEDLLDAELLPVLVELRCRFTPVLRHDHPLDLRAQLETTESLAGRSRTTRRRSSTPAIFHPDMSGDVPPRVNVMPVRFTVSASLAASVRRRRPLPPMMIGGCGRWTGRGWIVWPVTR